MPIERLIQLRGKFKGNGKLHNGVPFVGVASVEPLIDQMAVEISYKAMDDDDYCFHEERCIVARDFFGTVKMWNLSSNTPGMLELEQREKGDKTVFGLGNKEDPSVFRQEIVLEVGDDNKFGYHYYCGMPEGEFGYKSGLLMDRYEG